MKSLFTVLCFIWTLLLAPNIAAQTPESFAPQALEEKIAEIDLEIKDSKKYALVNQGWDTTIKITLLFLAIAAAAGTAYVAAQPKESTPLVGLKIFNAISATLTAALTTFAFTQFDFGKRQTVWRERSIQLAGCRDVLRYTNPVPEKFIAQLTEVLKLGDGTALNQLTASCAPGTKSAGAGAGAGGTVPKPAASAASR